MGASSNSYATIQEIGRASVTPPIIGGFLATQSFSGAILAAVNLVISIVMYVPFVSLATRQELKKVAEAQ